MGREVRRVPANWEHPKKKPKNDPYNHGGYQPQFQQDWQDAMADWLERLDEIRTNGVSEQEKEYYPRGLADWLQDDGRPPHPDYYSDYGGRECTWFQVYETVSEGTPVTPAFATKEELISYLAENGDFWDQKRCKEPDWEKLWGGKPGVSAWGREAAERFVGAEWVPSMIVTHNQHGTKVISPRDGGVTTQQ